MSERMKIVTRQEHEDFIKNYPRKLNFSVFAHICDPPVALWQDDSLGFFPDIVVAAMGYGMDDKGNLLPEENVYRILEMQKICPVESSTCVYKQNAPFNYGNPMCPMEQTCEECQERFLLTYERG